VAVQIAGAQLQFLWSSCSIWPFQVTLRGVVLGLPGKAGAVSGFKLATKALL